jgi:hypothetical protein
MLLSVPNHPEHEEMTMLTLAALIRTRRLPSLIAAVAVTSIAALPTPASATDAVTAIDMCGKNPKCKAVFSEDGGGYVDLYLGDNVIECPTQGTQQCRCTICGNVKGPAGTVGTVHGVLTGTPANTSKPPVGTYQPPANAGNTSKPVVGTYQPPAAADTSKPAAADTSKPALGISKPTVATNQPPAEASEPAKSSVQCIKAPCGGSPAVQPPVQGYPKPVKPVIRDHRSAERNAYASRSATVRDHRAPKPIVRDHRTTTAPGGVRVGESDTARGKRTPCIGNLC